MIQSLYFEANPGICDTFLSFPRKLLALSLTMDYSAGQRCVSDDLHTAAQGS